VFTRNSFDFRNDSRPDPTSGSTRGHVARPQFGVADHDGTNADDVTIHFSHQSYFPVTVGEESFDYLVSDWSRPCLNDGSRVVFGCDTSNGSVMDFQEAACVLGSHLTNSDGHGRDDYIGDRMTNPSSVLEIVGRVNAVGPCTRAVGSPLEGQNKPRDGSPTAGIPAAHRIGMPARWYSEFRS
jgi:hypothetical protein